MFEQTSLDLAVGMSAPSGFMYNGVVRLSEVQFIFASHLKFVTISGVYFYRNKPSVHGSNCCTQQFFNNCEAELNEWLKYIPFVKQIHTVHCINVRNTVRIIIKCNPIHDAVMYALDWRSREYAHFTSVQSGCAIACNDIIKYGFLNYRGYSTMNKIVRITEEERAIRHAARSVIAEHGPNSIIGADFYFHPVAPDFEDVVRLSVYKAKNVYISRACVSKRKLSENLRHLMVSHGMNIVYTEYSNS